MGPGRPISSSRSASTGREETYERVWRADHPESLSGKEGEVMGLCVLNDLD